MKIKRGNTFILQCQVLEDGEPRDCTGWTVASQIRFGCDFVVDLVFNWIDQTEGTFQLYYEDTTAWPVGNLQMDILYTTENDQLISTENLTITCIAQVTRP